MMYRFSSATSGTYGRGISETPSSPSIPSPSDNPLLSTMAVASDRLRALQSQADDWLANAQGGIALTRDAQAFAALAGEMRKRVSGGGHPETLSPSLHDFAVRNALISPATADQPLNADSLLRLESSLQTLALNSSGSSTQEQIRLKRFVTSYDNTLTLYNSVISRLGEITKKVVNSI